MHRYLRSIGFSQYKKKEAVEELLSLCQDRYFDMAKASAGDFGEVALEIRVPVADHMGLCIKGILDENNRLTREDYYPYITSSIVSASGPVSIYRHVDNRKYSALSDDPRAGITLIFTLDDSAGQIDRLKAGLGDCEEYDMYLAAFSDDAKVLMPLQKKVGEPVRKKAEDGQRDDLIDAARGGDVHAMEKLTFSEMQIFASVARRLQKEDIYSIVETCILPMGVECDTYQVIGEITAVEEVRNNMTGERLFDLTVISNDLPFHVGINAADLQGEPEPGRRFKGSIWMMGRIIPALKKN